MTNKTIKKTNVAVLRATGVSNDTIAKQYGITKDELVEGLKVFGMYKERTVAPKDYTITWEDDTADVQTTKKELTYN